jgi:UDP-glucose 4-epimerase
VVNAFLLAEEKVVEGQNEILNVCTGKKTKVETLVNQISDSIGGVITARYEGHTPGDQFGIYGDHSGISKKWGWTPQVDLNEGIDRMVQWAKTSV